MKRIAWLMLPLVLCALVWGVKWRADHPTPTKLDLQARALMLEASDNEVSHHHRDWRKQKAYDLTLSHTDLKALTQYLYILPEPVRWNRMKTQSNGAVVLSCSLYPAIEKKGEVMGIHFEIPVDEFDGREGRAHLRYLGRNVEYRLHPTTTKRWTYFLLNHARLGPAIHARLKS